MRSFAMIGCVSLAAAAFAAGMFVRPAVPAAAAAKPAVETPALKAGFVCMVELMKRSTKWQEEAAAMNKRRAEKAVELTALRTAFEQKKTRAEVSGGDVKQAAEQQAAEAMAKFQQAEQKFRADLDTQSAEILRTIHKEVTEILADVAKERNLHAVFAYPASPTRGMTKEERASTLAMDMYFRPTAMMPLYLKDALDVTDEVVGRMNDAHVLANDK